LARLIRREDETRRRNGKAQRESATSQSCAETTQRKSAAQKKAASETDAAPKNRHCDGQGGEVIIAKNITKDIGVSDYFLRVLSCSLEFDSAT
jgi:hypothetical protein